MKCPKCQTENPETRKFCAEKVIRGVEEMEAVRTRTLEEIKK